MKLHFLGTGTSFGVPVIGCDCSVCTSPDPRDRRTRHAALLSHGNGRLLIDTPPELRLQLIRDSVPGIDAVWFTHFHADHTHGLDDLRVFSVHRRGVLPAYASVETGRVLADKFAYVFDPRMKPIEGTTRPEAELRVISPYAPIEIAGFDLTPLPVPHGNVEVLGFRTGSLGYITDAKSLPARTFQALRGVRTLVLNALWFGRPHPTHFNVEEAVEVAREVGAERTYLTHISHRAGHRELLERLPAGILPAYDGLVVEI